MNTTIASKVYDWAHTGKNERISCIVKLNRNDAQVMAALNIVLNNKIKFGGSFAKLRITFHDIPISIIAEISDLGFVDYIEAQILHYTS